MLEITEQGVAAALGLAALATPLIAKMWLRTRSRRGYAARRETTRRARIEAVRARGTQHAAGTGAAEAAPRAATTAGMPTATPPAPASGQEDPASRRPVLVTVAGSGPRRDRPAARDLRRPPPPFSGRAWVVDGDTIVVAKARIRLFGMDAPELDQRGGTRAKSALIGLCRKERVTVEPLSFDCYDRIVAKVWLGDTDLSERMVRDGFAVATSRWNRDYLPAEREARAGRRGLWQDCPDQGITDPAAHRAARRRGAEGDAKDTPPRRPWLT